MKYYNEIWKVKMSFFCRYLKLYEENIFQNLNSLQFDQCSLFGEESPLSVSIRILYTHTYRRL